MSIDLSNKKAFLVVGVLLILLSAFIHWDGQTLLYLFYLRVPLLSGLLLFALPAISIYGLPSLLANLFVLNNPLRMAYITVATLAVGLAIVLMGAVIGGNADERFGLVTCSFFDSLASERSWLPYLLSIILAAPTVWACYWSSGPVSGEMSNQKRLYGFALGIALSVLFLASIYLIRTQVSSQSLEKMLLGLVSMLPEKSRAGYLHANSASALAPGQLTLACFLLVSTLLYFIGLPLFRPTSQKKKMQLPALGYVLGLIQIFSLIFGMLGFLLDYYRIPLLLSFLGFSALCYWLWKVDHYYDIKQSSIAKPDVDQMRQAIKNRLAGGNTLVVVCASGGGIQAAGWMTQVLKGLQEQKELGEDFIKSIGLISAVSGGSVGTMYYLDRFGANGYPEKVDLEPIFQAATHDSLGATGWGLVYPDLWRFVGLPFLRTLPRDRGRAIDTVWKSQMTKPLNTIGDWIGPIKEGKLPIPVLNATLVEDGRHYLISPMTFNIQPRQGVEFNQLYPACDVDSSTAALLSATFPYVTPITRNTRPEQNEPIFHVADGGYFDNFGVVTAVDWLDRIVLPHHRELGIKKVMLVEINAFPVDEPIASAPDKPVGWFMAVFGPALTIANARNSTQSQRNSESVEELKEEWMTKGVDMQKFDIVFPKMPFFALPVTTGCFIIDQWLAKLLAEKQEKSYSPPLSWMLTKRQRQRIVEGWEKLVQDKDKNLVDLIDAWKNR